MADIERMDIHIQAHDKASHVLENISKKFGVFSKEGLSVGLTFALVNKAIDFLMQGINALVQSVAQGIENFREFEYRLTAINTLLSENEKSLLPAVKRGIEGLALATGKSVNELSDAMYDILNANVKASDAFYVLKESVKLSIATFSDLKTSVDVVTSVLNAYNISATRASYVANVLTKALIEGKMTMEDLSTGLGAVITDAATAGIRFEELMGAISTLSLNGMKGRRAISGLREIIQTLVNPTDEAQKEMFELGFAFDANILEIEGLSGVFKKLNEKIGNNVAEWHKLFTSSSAISAALALSANNVGLLEKSISNITDSSKKLDDIFNQLNDTSLQTRKRQEALSAELDRAAGEALKPAVDVWGNFLNVLKLYIFTGGNARETMKRLAEVAKKTSEALDTSTIEPVVEVFAQMNDEIGNLESLKSRMQIQKVIYQQNLKELEAQKEILLQTQKYNEILHYIPLALKYSEYSTRIFDATTRQLVDAIRRENEELEKLKKEHEAYNLVLEERNIEEMKIQLAALKRRGRMTREEKQRLKELEIANLETRIAIVQNQIKQSKLAQSIEEKTERLELIKTHYNEELYIIQNAYQREIDALNTRIQIQKMLLDEYLDYEIDIDNKILSEKERFVSTYNKIMSSLTGTQQKALTQKMKESGIPIPETTAKQAEGNIPSSVRALDTFLRKYFYQKLPKAQGGGYVERTGLAVIHRGEKIIPAEREAITRIHVEPISVNVVIEDNADIPQLVEKIALSVKAGLISGIQTKYR